MSVGGSFPMLMMIGLLIILLNIFNAFDNKGAWCIMTKIINIITCIYSIIGTIITIYSAKGATVPYRF